MKNSARGSVDPFIVMDVMEAASKKEKSGYEVGTEISLALDVAASSFYENNKYNLKIIFLKRKLLKYFTQDISA